MGTSLALAAALGIVLARDAEPRTSADELLDDDAVREEAVRQLVDRSAGIFDSHVDPDVAKTLQHGLHEREYLGASVTTNLFGMRDRPHALEKPDGVVRVVLLGDSYVFGYGIPAQHRAGVFLEQILEEVADTRPRRVEVLHVGVPSWNTISEAAYLRRQLGLLRPDLVVHVFVRNDLDDTTGIRGFGVGGWYTPQHRERADGIVAERTIGHRMGMSVSNPLLHGIDHEGRARWERIGDEVERLAAAVEAVGGRYLFVPQMVGYYPVVRHHVTDRLREEQYYLLPKAFAWQPEHWNSQTDRHWNRRGQGVFATLIYGVIQERGLLPELGGLTAQDESTALLEEYERSLLEEAEQERVSHRLVQDLELEPVMDFENALEAAADQVYAGIDSEGNVSPYASVVLPRGDGSTVRITGTCYDRPEIAGGRATVSIEGVPAGTIALDEPGPFQVVLDVPPEAREARYLNVTLEADDWVYLFDNGWRCVCLRIDRIAVGGE